MSKRLTRSSNPAKSNQSKGMSITHAEFFQGPIPRPETIERYNAVYPRAAEIIFTNLEKQTNHRIEMERKHLISSLRCRSFGSGAAFIVVLLFFGMGFYLIITNRLIEGWSAVIIVICGIAKAYIESLKTPDIDNKQKSQETKEKKEE